MMHNKYYLKIELLGLKSPVWREFVVPSSITLDRLHQVLQIVMGWKDQHFHKFIQKDKIYSTSLEDVVNNSVLEENLYTLGDLLKKEGDSFHYIYDFSDQWDHVVTLEHRNYNNEDMIECKRIFRACPPENVGGVEGFLYFYNIIKDPTHIEHENFIHWYKINYNTNEIYDAKIVHIGVINYELNKFLKYSKIEF